MYICGVQKYQTQKIMISNILFTVLPGLVLLIMLLWIRYSCIKKSTFPTLGHLILLTLLGFVPFLGMMLALFIVAFYIGLRLTGDIGLKPTKFNKIFFDIKDNE